MDIVIQILAVIGGWLVISLIAAGLLAFFRRGR